PSGVWPPFPSALKSVRSVPGAVTARFGRGPEAHLQVVAAVVLRQTCVSARRSARPPPGAVTLLAAWPSPAHGPGTVLAPSGDPGSVSPVPRPRPASAWRHRASRQPPSSTSRLFLSARRSGPVARGFWAGRTEGRPAAAGSTPPPAAVALRSAVARLSPQMLRESDRLL